MVYTDSHGDYIPIGQEKRYYENHLMCEASAFEYKRHVEEFESRNKINEFMKNEANERKNFFLKTNQADFDKDMDEKSKRLMNILLGKH